MLDDNLQDRLAVRADDLYVVDPVGQPVPTVHRKRAAAGGDGNLPDHHDLAGIVRDVQPDRFGGTGR